MEVRNVDVDVAGSHPRSAFDGKEWAFHRAASLDVKGKSLRLGVDPEDPEVDSMCLKIEACIAKSCCCCFDCDFRCSVVACCWRPSMDSRTGSFRKNVAKRAENS